MKNLRLYSIIAETIDYKNWFTIVSHNPLIKDFEFTTNNDANFHYNKIFSIYSITTRKLRCLEFATRFEGHV